MKNKRLALQDTQRIYDSYITFQNKVVAEGPFKPLDEYEDCMSLWAESRFLRGRNFYAARSANVKTDVEFVVRYRTDLNEKMRIKLDNKFYNIEGILPLDNNRMYMTIKAYEIKYDM